MTYTQPILLVFLTMAAIGLLRLRHCRRKSLAIAGIAGLFLASWPPIGWLLSRPLESGYPAHAFVMPPQVQAIVVLGGSVEAPKLTRPYALAGDQTYQRCQYAAWIYSQYGPLPVVASGGRDASGHPPVAATMGDLLRKSGVPENMIWLEDRSRSTYENAVESAAILRRHGISRVALVVDATSMARAAACFRKLGIEVAPAPSSFRRLGSSWRDDLLPGWDAIRENEDTLHEAVGLIYYRIRGRI